MISSKQKNGGGGGCGDQIKKLKQDKSMKEANPDGLNKLQVSTDFLASSSKMRTMKNTEISVSSKQVSSSDHPGSKAFAKDQVRSSELKPVRSSMKKNSGVGLHSTVNLSRATCSSTVKIDRNPESLDLDGVSNQKLCSYKYCSLHGQKKNEASLPPLKCFLSARKQSVKLPNNMKKKEQSSTRKNVRKSFEENEAEIVDIVNGINGKMIMEDSYETNQSQESYSVTSFEDYADNNSEISVEELKVFDEGLQYAEVENQEEACLESEKGNSSQCFDDVKVDHEIQQSKTFSYDNEEESANGSLQSGIEIPKSPKELLKSDWDHLKVNCEESIRSNNDKDRNTISENPLAELTNRPKPIYSTARKITADNQENARAFNLRPHRFLPLKPEPEAEVVNLKHQNVDERKTAEEWMIDYALQKTLRRMAPARKRKVALLIAAFESVIQQE